MKILVIDDEVMILKLLEHILKGAGYETLVMSDSNAAYEISKSGTYDLVITDLMMPGKEGIEIISDLRDLLNDKINIIAMSSDSDAGFSTLLTLARTVGADATLKKPFTKESILELVKQFEK